jgi:hypothetical protein
VKKLALALIILFPSVALAQTPQSFVKTPDIFGEVSFGVQTPVLVEGFLPINSVGLIDYIELAGGQGVVVMCIPMTNDQAIRVTHAFEATPNAGQFKAYSFSNTDCTGNRSAASPNKMKVVFKTQAGILEP